MRETGVFGQRLAQLRQEAGLSQQALADRLAVTRQAVSNWEREQTLPDLDMLRALARALGTDLNTLCGAAPAAPRRRGFFFAEIQYVKFGTQKRKKCANDGLLWVLDKNIDFEPMVLARRRRA